MPPDPILEQNAAEANAQLYLAERTVRIAAEREVARLERVVVQNGEELSRAKQKTRRQTDEIMQVRRALEELQEQLEETRIRIRNVVSEREQLYNDYGQMRQESARRGDQLNAVREIVS